MILEKLGLLYAETEDKLYSEKRELSDNSNKNAWVGTIVQHFAFNLFWVPVRFGVNTITLDQQSGSRNIIGGVKDDTRV